MGRHRSTWLAAPIALLLLAVADPAARADVIEGTAGPDTLIGTAGGDTIRGLGGGDTIDGKGGRDRLFAGQDRRRDHVFGGAGADRIHSTTYDWVHAGKGDDTVVFKPALGSGRRHTRIYCGPGDDTVVRLPGYGGVWTFGCEHHVQGLR